MKLDLVTGFLGAGKTTLISRFCRYFTGQGWRFGVVENEFGAAGVDSAILREDFGEVRELSGGCICCTLKSGFYTLLEELSHTCDRVIVEPSGLYNLDDYFEVADALVRDGVAEYGMCLTLADPRTLERLDSAEREILRDELIGTGAVVWTKTDLAPECDLAGAEALLREIAGELSAEVYPVSGPCLTDGDLAKLLEMTPRPQAHTRVFRDHQTLYQSTVLYPAGEYTPAGLRAAAEEMLSGSCGTVLRLKGFVNAGEGSLALNCTADAMQIDPCGRQPATVNVIGRGLRRREMKAVLERGAAL